MQVHQKRKPVLGQNIITTLIPNPETPLGNSTQALGKNLHTGNRPFSILHV